MVLGLGQRGPLLAGFYMFETTLYALWKRLQNFFGTRVEKRQDDQDTASPNANLEKSLKRNTDCGTQMPSTPLRIFPSPPLLPNASTKVYLYNRGKTKGARG